MWNQRDFISLYNLRGSLALPVKNPKGFKFGNKTPNTTALIWAAAMIDRLNGPSYMDKVDSLWAVAVYGAPNAYSQWGGLTVMNMHGGGH